MGVIKQELYNQHQNILALIFGALSHPGRLKIVLLLQLHDSLSLGEIQIAIGLSQSATSDQVSKLKNLGLLKSVCVGTSVRYSLDITAWQEVTVFMRSFLDVQLI